MLIGNVEDYSIAQGIKRKDLSSCDIEKVKDNFCFRVGILNFEIIHTPGHTAGGICLFEKLVTVFLQEIRYFMIVMEDVILQLQILKRW